VVGGVGAKQLPRTTTAPQSALLDCSLHS